MYVDLGTGVRRTKDVLKSALVPDLFTVATFYRLVPRIAMHHVATTEFRHTLTVKAIIIVAVYQTQL